MRIGGMPSPEGRSFPRDASPRPPPLRAGMRNRRISRATRGRAAYAPKKMPISRSADSTESEP